MVDSVALENKVYNLIRKCIGHLDVSTTRLVLLDHGYEYTEDRVNELMLDVEHRMRAKALVDGAEYRARDKNIDFTLTEDWVYEKLKVGICEKTKIKFIYTQSNSEPNPYAPSIDRIDNSRGYTFDNSRLVLISYNKFKSDYREEDINKIIKELCLLS